MKTKLFSNLSLYLIIAWVLVSSSLYAQDITGQWNGVLNAGMQLRIVFHIEKSDTGFTGKMDSPDQKAFGIPLTSVSWGDSLIKLSLKSAQIVYEGKLNKENVIEGTFKQGGAAFSMNLSKEEIELAKPLRPQEPVEPYPYYSEQVKFDNAKDKITLAGTLTLPAKAGVFPAVILITGSGAQNRNEEIMGHKPFLVLADYLTRNGIAVLRYDDRGYAESTGEFSTATTLDFATDVKSAIAYLKTRKEIDGKKIGLIGHSEGGIIAPMVAAHSKDVSFIVLLAGTGIPGDQLLLLQAELIARASGAKDSEIQQAKKINTGVYELVKKATNNDSLIKDLTEYINVSMNDMPKSEKPDENTIKSQISQITNPWMQFFIKYDPYPVLKDVKCPVLAINGSKDLQVPPKVNLEAIRKGLEEGGNKNVTIQELPGLNHLFQECTTGSPQEYAQIQQTFSPAALSVISTWILKQAN
jgi:uncharacterized protein